MNIVTKTKLSEGANRAVFHFYFESDGQEGELDNTLLVDPQVDFDTDRYPISENRRCTITKIWYSAAVFDMVIKFNALLLTPVWVIVPDADSYICFDYFGGLKDQSTAQHDGKILISTNGFITPGSIGTMVLEIKKN